MHGCAVNFFCIGQHALLGIQALIFAGLNFRVLDFAFLKHPEIDQAQSFMFPVLEPLDARVNLFPFCERFANGIELYSGKFVKEFESNRAVERN